jgi:hypothetical protein
LSRTKYVISYGHYTKNSMDCSKNKSNLGELRGGRWGVPAKKVPRRGRDILEANSRQYGENRETLHHKNIYKNENNVEKHDNLTG